MGDSLNDNNGYISESDHEIYSNIAGALASRYEAIYYIDKETGNYIQYSASKDYAKLGTTKQGKDFFKDAVNDIRRFVYSDDSERLLKEMNKDRLLTNLSNDGFLSFTYRQLLNNKIQYVSMQIVCPKNDDRHILIGVTNIDSQIRREKAMADEGAIFSEIALALAKRYEVIYLVDINTNEYSEFSASEKYSKLKVGSKGKDFFAETQVNMKRDIYPEDYPMMAYSMQKDHLLESLKDTGKNMLNYRLMLDGRPQYVTLFAVQPNENSETIIIAVANIDTAKRMEENLEEVLDSAMDAANNDALTNFKNKRYYAQTEMTIDKEIEDGKKPEFAILVCDINGLKRVNDRLGHSAGDDFIKDAAQLLTDVFENSTIFRIGGDEFLIILRGEEYKERVKLIDRLKARNRVNYDANKATIAFGMSDFNPDKDLRVQDVFERADAAMYDTKRILKHLYAKEEDRSEIVDSETYSFYKLFGELVSAMTKMDSLDYNMIRQIISDISNMFRLSRGVARLYRNPQEEESGGGETITTTYDLNIKDKQVIFLRIVTSVMSIGTIAVYMAEDEKPLSDVEYSRVELVMRTTLSYLTRNRLRDIVEELTYSDESGFPNFRSFKKYIMKNRMKLGGKVAVRYNLRHFNLVNLEKGRRIGDIVMRGHYEGLKNMIGDHGTVGRLGGDNYVAVFEREQMGNVLSYLSEAPIVYDVHDGRYINVAASVGVYCMPDDFVLTNIGEIMEKIIPAYTAARSGNAEKIVFYDDSLLISREKSMRVQQMFPSALRHEEFLVYYQPKVNIETGELVGAEALCRWKHAGKIIPPVDFIPMLEETSDVCKLDYYVLEHVCRDIRRWIDEGRKAVRVSVNFSRKHMMDADLTESILKIVDRYKVPHDYIEIELTETTTDVEFVDLKRVVNKLQEAGIYTSVDDFGVGYSSLNLIKEMPWNVLKVDRSFLPSNSEDFDNSRSTIFKHLIAMVKEIGLECIVEGVETKEQLDILRNNRCELAQGFIFDKPLPVADFESKLNDGFRYEIP